MGEDYIRRGALGALLVIVALVALGAVPAHSVGGVSLRRINILSQLLDNPKDESVEVELVELELDEEEYVVDLAAVATEAEAARNMMEVMVSEVEGAPIAEELITPTEDRLLPDNIELTPIESFDTLKNGKLNRFYKKLSTKGATTRIAVLGDSFIEGDILTADLREALQLKYGGCGAGFTPLSSPLTKYRKTIKTDSRGWKSYNIMQRKSTPERYAQSWAVSGWLAEAEVDGASVRWECTDNREMLDSCSRVRILFVSREACEIAMSVNDVEAKNYRFEGSEMVQQIEVEAEWISCCEMKIVSGANGFVGYGAIFEGDGVVVDNFSTRSNNGQAMLWTNPTINAQMDGAVGGYDMVILQYGLNILQRGVKNYTAYAEQIEKMIAFAQLCFPNAAVMVMGVSDRSMRENGHYEPLVEAIDMSSYQREAAHRSGTSFWNTHSAMGARGGMAEFVANNWAAKDFTHINFAGGREIGRALAEAINVARREAYPPEIKKLEIDPLVNHSDLEVLRARSMVRDRDLESRMMECVEQDKKRRGHRGIW